MRRLFSLVTIGGLAAASLLLAAPAGASTPRSERKLPGWGMARQHGRVTRATRIRA